VLQVPDVDGARRRRQAGERREHKPDSEDAGEDGDEQPPGSPHNSSCR
jgi:hypothetical protein